MIQKVFKYVCFNIVFDGIFWTRKLGTRAWCDEKRVNRSGMKFLEHGKKWGTIVLGVICHLPYLIHSCRSPPPLTHVGDYQIISGPMIVHFPNMGSVGSLSGLMTKFGHRALSILYAYFNRFGLNQSIFRNQDATRHRLLIWPTSHFHSFKISSGR